MGNSVDKLLFQPPRPASYTNSPNFFPLSTGKNLTIQAFFVRHERAKFTILFSHGNAEDIGMIYDWFKEVAIQLECNVMGYDYLGYGLSDGEKPSETDCFYSAQAAFDFLTETQGYMPDEIVLYGRSLGSGASCELGSKLSREGRPPAGVILQSPLMSAYRVAFHFRYSMPGDMMCNIDKIPSIDAPVFILHGRRDEIVPFWHGECLYLATKPKFRYPPLWVEDAGHNNIEVIVQRKKSGLFFQRLKEFFHYLQKNERGIADEDMEYKHDPSCCSSRRTEAPKGEGKAIKTVLE